MWNFKSNVSNIRPMEPYDPTYRSQAAVWAGSSAVSATHSKGEGHVIRGHVPDWLCGLHPGLIWSKLCWRQCIGLAWQGVPCHPWAPLAKQAPEWDSASCMWHAGLDWAHMLYEAPCWTSPARWLQHSAIQPADWPSDPHLAYWAEWIWHPSLRLVAM